MKIAWFTPFSLESRIGRFSGDVVAPLGTLAEVDLWFPDCGAPRTTSVRTVPFQRAEDVDAEALDRYDLLVYNLGNYLSFHREIYRLSQRRPGLVILHDHVMHDFFWEYFIGDRKAPEAYVLAMQRLYGAEGRTVAEETLAGRRPPVCSTDEVLRFPFFEDAIRGAYGVLVHSEFLRARVAQVHAGPVAKLHLPCAPIPGLGTLTRKQLGVPERSVLLVTVGHVNPNKRIHAVLEALAGQSAPARSLVYTVLGPADPTYRERLLELARRSGLERTLRLPGYVSEEVLESYIEQANICVNLRYPATEGASASAIEEMMRGKPLVVSNTGFYAELPEDCVLKIDPRREAEQLPRTLKRLIGDAKLRRALGRRAAEFTAEHCRPEDYAHGLLQFAHEVKDAIPMLQLADRLAVEFNTLGVHKGMPIVEAVARQASSLLN